MGDIEKATREIRSAKSAASDRRWDLLETRLATIETALEGLDDADKAPVLAEIEPLRQEMIRAQRAEKAARIEREIRRSLDNAAEERSRDGYPEVPLQKAADRLASPEAQECLEPERVQRLRDEIAALQGGPKTEAAAAAPSPAATTPAPATAAPAESAPPAPVRAPAASAPPAPIAAPAANAPPAAAPSDVDPEKARLIENDLVRMLNFAADDVQNSPDQAAAKAERAESRLDSAEAQQHLSAATQQRLRARIAELRQQIAAEERAEQLRRIEEQIGRYTRQAESDAAHDPRSAVDMLRKAEERLASEEARSLLPEDVAREFRETLERVRARLGGDNRQRALDKARPLLEELEQRLAGTIFDGSEPAYHVVATLEALQSRVRGALDGLSAEDPEVRVIEAQLAAANIRIAAATAALDRAEQQQRVLSAWALEQQAMAGWETEVQPEQQGPLRSLELPQTTLVMHRLGRFLADEELARLRAEAADDPIIQDVFREAERIVGVAGERLDQAFNAILEAAECSPRPASRIDLEMPAHLAERARSDFAGTRYLEANVSRAEVLSERWEREIESERAARKASYDALTQQADAAWPAIEAKIVAAQHFDPQDLSTRGERFYLKGIRNRIGWDVGGPYDFAAWVNEIPVVGLYDAHVAAAVQAARNETGLPLDEYTDWDAVVVLGDIGRIKQRFRVTVRDRNQLEIGQVEEWRPVPCRLCTVIALRAGPVAVGPES